MDDSDTSRYGCGAVLTSAVPFALHVYVERLRGAATARLKGFFESARINRLGVHQFGWCIKWTTVEIGRRRIAKLNTLALSSAC